MAMETYPAVLPLTMIQFAIGSLIAIAMSLRNWCYGRSYTEEKLHTDGETSRFSFITVPIGITFAVGQLCTNASLSISSVALTNAIKATEPCVALIYSILILQNRIPNKAILYMILLIVGAAITSKADAGFSVNGILYAAISNVVLQTRNVLIKLAVDGSSNIKGLTLFFYSSTFGLIFLMITNIVYNNWIGFNWAGVKDINYICIMAGVFFALQHISSYMVLDYALITTHALLNVSKRVLVILVGSVVLGTILSFQQILGICIAFSSLYFYAQTLKKYNTNLPTLKTYTTLRERILRYSLCVFLVLAYVLVIGSLSYNKRSTVSESDNFELNEVSGSKYYNLALRKKPDDKVLKGAKFTFIWAHTKEISNTSLSVIDILSYNASAITVYCGTIDCNYAVTSLHKENVKVLPLKVIDMLHGTAAYPWIRMFPLIKVITGPHFEDELQTVVVLSTLLKAEGIVVNLDFPPIKQRKLVGIMDGMSINSCLFAGNEKILACNLEKNDLFIQNLLAKFINNYTVLLDLLMLDSEPKVLTLKSWPFRVDFKQIVQDTYILCGRSCPTRKEFGPDINYENKPQKKKFALLHYKNTLNVGDHIQSLAAAHFLPRVDNLFDRDTQPNISSNHTMILNAWWPAQGFLHNLPPYINPVLTAIHIDQASKNKTAQLLNKNMDMYKNFGPVGARDMETYGAFKKLNIPTMFSACMTLFLKNFYQNDSRSEIIVAVDFPERLMDVVKKHTGKNIIQLRHNTYNNQNELRMFAIAHKYLTLYARAKLVLTNRIHVALPCVAFGTPVILYANGFTGQTRFSGLMDLFHTIDPKILSSTFQQTEYLNKFNWENPPSNPNFGLYKNFTQKTWSLLKRVKEFKDVRYMFDLGP